MRTVGGEYGAGSVANQVTGCRSDGAGSRPSAVEPRVADCQPGVATRGQPGVDCPRPWPDKPTVPYSRGSPSRYRAPGPDSDARSPGLKRAQVLSDRQPQPMQSSRSSRSRPRSRIRSSSSPRHDADIFAQSRRFGVRPSGRVWRALRTASRVMPIACAARMTATRLSTTLL